MSEHEQDEQDVDYQVVKYHWVSGAKPDCHDEFLELLIPDDEWSPEKGVEHLGKFCHEPEYHGALWMITDETDPVESADFGILPRRWVGGYCRSWNGPSVGHSR